MDNREKILSKIKLGLVVKEFLVENKKSGLPNSVTSLRKLAAASDIEYSIIQRISSGKKDPQFTTLLNLADGLGVSLQEIISKFDAIELNSVLKIYNSQKRTIKNKKK